MRFTTLIFLFLGIVVAMLPWLITSYSGSSRLRVVFCNVGQGDATLFQFKRKQILIDGGSGHQVEKCLEKQMPLFDRIIDVVIITHPDQDHFEGLIHVLKDYKINSILKTSISKDTEVYRELYKEIERSVSEGSKLRYIYAGDVVSLNELQLKALWPSDASIHSLNVLKEAGNGLQEVSVPEEMTNVLSLVIYIRFGNFDLLVHGDAEASVQNQILSSEFTPEEVEVMTVPHHGSKNGLSKEWLERISPKLAIISVGSGNTYGHPNKQILQILNEKYMQNWRTDHNGDAVIESDGQRWWIVK